MKILIAEDDQNILNGLKEIFQGEGYQTVLASNGTEAVELYKTSKPNFICLDIMMPGLGGYDVCKEIRNIDPDVPIIFISAKSEEIDKVLGLELGADDYIVKPFGIKEVIARIRAVTRRYLAGKDQNIEQAQFNMNSLEIIPTELRCRRNNETIDLSIRDIKILQCLYKHANQAVSRDTLFQAGWDIDHMPNSRTLDQHISQLRKKIELDPQNPEIIKTVHGIGYRFEY